MIKKIVGALLLALLLLISIQTIANAQVDVRISLPQSHQEQQHVNPERGK